MHKSRKNIRVKYTKRCVTLCSIFIALFVCVLSLSNFDSTKSFAAVNTYGSKMIADSYNDVIFDGVIAKGTDITAVGTTLKSSKYTGTNTSVKSTIYLMCPNVAYYYDASGSKKWIDAKIYPYGKTNADNWTILKSGNSTDGWNLQFAFTGSNATRTAKVKYEFYESGTTTRISKNLIMTYGTGRTNHAIEVNRELDKMFFDSTRNLVYIKGGNPYNDNSVVTGCNPKGTSSGSVGEGNTYLYQCEGFGNGVNSDHIYLMVPSSLDLVTQFVYWSPDVNGWNAGIFNATDPAGTTGHTKVADYSTIKYHITNSKSDATEWKTYTNRKLRYSNAAASDFIDLTKVSPKKGYKLSSQWTTNADGTGTTLPASFTNSGYNLYAYLSPITYKVSYNGNGSTGGSTATSSHTYDKAQALTANGFTRAYTVTYSKNGGTCADSATATYTFAGWATSSSATTAKYANKESVTNLSSTDGATVPLYAVWTKKSVTLPTPTKTGCTFKGWYTDSGFTTLAGNAGAAYTPTKNITLYAKWEANPYTLTFNKNGGTQTESQRTVIYGAQIGSLPTPTKTGYSFDGWYNETGLTTKVNVSDTMPAANKTVYAKYTPITYSIKYDGNGKTGGTMSNSPHTYDAAKKLSKNTYTRSYTVTYDNDNGSCTPYKDSDVATYDFKGWALTNTATTESYSDEQSVTNLTNESGKTITLYAVWQPQGVVLPNATKENGTFNGWYTNAALTQFAGNAGDTYIPRGNVTLYPNFGPARYFVSFVDSDGTTKLFDDLAFDVDGSIYGTRIYGEDNHPVKEGYLFGGWYDLSDTTYEHLVLPEDAVTGDTVLRARWFAVSIGSTSAIYTGSQISPVITVEDDKHNALTAGTDYIVTCPPDMTNVGTRVISVEGTLNNTMHYGTVTFEFTIIKKVLTDTDIIITNYSESNPIIKEYDGTNSTEVLANNIDLAYASDTSIKIGFDYALYEDGTPNNADKKDVMLYNLTPPNSNYELAISDKTFTDYGMIMDTTAPKISKVEISSEPVIYGLGQTIELRITLSEEVTGTVDSSYTIDLLKPNSTDKFAEGIPLVFNSESKNEFTCEYTVKESDNGIDGIIGCVINKAGVDAYKDAFNWELDTSVSDGAKSFIKSIKIITDRFDVPVSVSPNSEETSENSIKFTFDLSDVDFEDDYDLDLLTDPVVIKVLGEELIINDDESGIVTIDKTDKKVVVTIDTTNEITPDNRDGITYKVRYEEDSITNKFNNGNNEVSKEIKVVRNLNHEDIVVTYKGASISHNGSPVLAEKDDTFTISIKPSSSAAGGTITYSDGLTDEVHDTTNTITDEKKTFENIVVSKEGWASSLPFGINFVFEEIPEEPDDGPDGPGGGEEPDGPGGGEEPDGPGGGGDTPGGNDNPKPNNNGGGNKGSSTTITIGGTSDSYLGYKPGQNHFAYMEGFKNSTFKPDGKLTRAEMCAVLARINSEYDDSIDYSSSITFKDEKNNTKAWYRNYLGFAVKNKLVEGYPNGTYKASGNITRAEFVTVISKAFSINTNYSSHIFSDAKNKWYEKYVNNLAYYGYVEGRNDKKFHGNDYITRAEACKIINAVLNRDLRTKNTLSDSLRERFTSTFKDVSSNKWYYYDIIEATMNY